MDLINSLPVLHHHTHRSTSSDTKTKKALDEKVLIGRSVPPPHLGLSLQEEFINPGQGVQAT